MPKQLYNVVLFHSMSGALKAEKLLKRDGVPIKLIPVPRQLSSDCGICVRFERADEEMIRSILNQGKVDIEGVYEI